MIGNVHQIRIKCMLETIDRTRSGTSNKFWQGIKQSNGTTVINLFYKIINGLAHVPFKGVLVEAYKGTRRKHNMKFRQIDHTTKARIDSCFFLKLLVHGTGLLSLKLRYWLYLDQIFLTISMHPFRIIP